MSAKKTYIWTPQDLSVLAGLRLPRSALWLYGVVLKFADRKTGAFTLSKAWAAANMNCSKRTADYAFDVLVRHGIVVREEVIRDGRQRANRWKLLPRECWVVFAAFARAKYQAIMARLKEQKVAKAKRLQLLNGAVSAPTGTTAKLKDVLTDDEVRRLREKLSFEKEGGQPLVVSSRLSLSRMVRR